MYAPPVVHWAVLILLSEYKMSKCNCELGEGWAQGQGTRKQVISPLYSLEALELGKGTHEQVILRECGCTKPGGECESSAPTCTYITLLPFSCKDCWFWNRCLPLIESVTLQTQFRLLILSEFMCTKSLDLFVPDSCISWQALIPQLEV